MSTIECYDGYTESAATECLRNNGFVQDHNGAFIAENDAVWSEQDSEFYHTDEALNCEQCNDSFHTENDHPYCESATFCCADCASDAGYFQHDDGEWHDYPESGLHGYHDVARTKYPVTTDKPFRIGFEVEKEDTDCREELENDACLPYGWIAEEDSSLDCNGFELVSPAYNVADSDTIEKDFDSLEQFLDADSSNNCGGHITISKYGTTGQKLAESMPGLFPLLMSIYPNRMRSTYARSTKFKPMVDSHDKHRAFRVSHSSIELRIISRVRNKTSLWWRYKLIRWFLNNTPSLATTRESLAYGWLREHLGEVYSDDQINDKIRLFDRFADWFYSLEAPHNTIGEYLTASI